MFNSPVDFETDVDDGSLDRCDAVLVCLTNRRFVVVRPDEPKRDLWPVNGGWEKIRQLKPGDAVIYKGTPARVRAVKVYV